MLSQQAPITNFFFVDRTPFSETLLRNRAVELRHHAQRVSRARARFQVLQDLRSRKSLWHPWVITKADLGGLGDSARQAESYIGSDSSGAASGHHHSEDYSQNADFDDCDGNGLPTSCPSSRHRVPELGRPRLRF